MGTEPAGGGRQTPTTATLEEILSRAVGSPAFPAYGGAPTRDYDRLRGELLQLAEKALRAGGADLEHWRSAIERHLDDPTNRARFYDGVSAFRVDRDPWYETQLAAAERRFKDAGAVHLELGTWTAWPAERADALRDADGLAEVIRLDFDATYELDVIADARALPFRDGSLDRISADSVLEHIPHPHRVLSECFRVLRPGGMLKVVTPFAFNLHGYPDDYLRYSPSWYRQMLREVGFETVETDVEATRGLYYTLHNCAKTAIVEADVSGADGLRTLHLLLLELLGILVPLDDAFHNGARHWFVAVQVFAVKGGTYRAPHRDRTAGASFVERTVDLLAVPGTDIPVRLEGGRLVASPESRFPVVDGVPRFTDGAPGRGPSSRRPAGWWERMLRRHFG